MSSDREIAVEAATAGATVIRDMFRTHFKSEIKANDKGLVTEVDLKAESAILDVLRRRSPYPILSEERGVIGKAEGPMWIVDPLDGTTNFSRGIPLFAVSIGLAHGYDVRAGVILDPITGDCYSAGIGEGSFFNGSKFTVQPFNEAAPVMFVNHGYAAEDRLRCAEVARRFIATWSLRKYGTTAREYIDLVAGRADVFTASGDEFWDYAAGLVIAREAGCVVSDWTGADWNGENSYILIAKREIHREIVVQIKDLQEPDTNRLPAF